MFISTNIFTSPGLSLFAVSWLLICLVRVMCTDLVAAAKAEGNLAPAGLLIMFFVSALVLGLLITSAMFS